ncbi:1-aminocyclopropane-1-carboxylate deaminase [Favolaschia claudopus]|uniref:1-aminocyclopropane-1-carboxylate deaminase n=1 Tax=Favolaschia claudopus TaxID=2862362 RepID=A0AAW0A6M0_9AGAR
MTPVTPLPAPFSEIPREPLLFGPSPIHLLSRMTADLGGKVKIWAKREDCNSALAFGGNKTRKLEYLLADALSQFCDTLVSIGGVQSNHTRQVAAVAAKYGLKAKLVQEHWVSWSDPVYSKVGNLQLSRLMGAEPRLDPSTFGIEHKPTAASLTDEVLAAGGKPYYIPAGASDHPLGGLGFARWAFEVANRKNNLTSLEKMGGRKRKVIGIDASAKPAETRAQVLRIARFTGVKIGLSEEDINDDDVILDERYPRRQTIEAIKYAASMDAFITDPVYEGKSLAGMIDLIRRGEISSGNLALNAYSDMESVVG